MCLGFHLKTAFSTDIPLASEKQQGIGHLSPAPGGIPATIIIHLHLDAFNHRSGRGILLLTGRLCSLLN